MEFLPGKVSLVTGVIFFISGMILVISPLILMSVTINTNIFLWSGLFQNFIGLVGFTLLYIPESTKFLLSNEKFKDA